MGRLSRRFTVVVAAAGYGKTSAIRDRLRDAATQWCTIDELGNLSNLDTSPPAWLVVDDLEPVTEAATLTSATGNLPDGAHLVLIARKPLRLAASRWRGRGDLTEIGPAELALDADEVAAVLRHEYGLGSAALAAEVHSFTAGWPALVHLAGQRLAAGQDDAQVPASPEARLKWLAEPGQAINAYLYDEVLKPLDTGVLAGLTDAANLELVTGDLLNALGHAEAVSIMELLSGIGLLWPVSGVRSGHCLVPLVAAVSAGFAAEGRRGEVLRAAAEWYEKQNLPALAASTHRRAGRPEKALRVLADHGELALVSGGAAVLIEAVQEVSVAKRPDRLQMLYGEALYMTGDTASALSALDILAQRREPFGFLDAPLAWRLGQIHYLSGDPGTALAVLDRADTVNAGPADNARLHAWTATVHWLLADVARCRRHADLSMAAALQSNDPAALAIAHVARALLAKIAGDPAGNVAHYERALHFAETAGDLVQVTRIRCNNSSRLCDDAQYAEALAMVRPAVRLGAAIGHLPMHALALVNAGNAYAGLGRLAEALASYEQAVWLYRRTGSRMLAYALAGVGQVHWQQGRKELAESSYLEALRVAEDRQDRQALIPALTGLTRLMAATSPGQARGHADLAMTIDAPASQVAFGWAILAEGNAPQAARIAAAAAASARQLQERAQLPEALELLGNAATEPDDARVALREAQTLWHQAGAELSADRMAVALGALPGATVTDLLMARLAAARLSAAGVVVHMTSAAGQRVAIRSFGRFEVLVPGAGPVIWQSRKARDLLRILVARRGRPISRDELGEMLWPEDDPAKVPHRLSVALSTVRGALDPQRRLAGDYFLPGTSSLALDTSRVDIDLEDFLLTVEHGLRLAREGDTGAAREALSAAMRMYQGDFFGDELYDDWAIAAREEARGAYLRIARALIDLSHDAGRTAEAIEYIHQVLHIDPYDESAHRRLIDILTAHGWHGEARRAKKRLTEAMRQVQAWV